MTVYIVFINDGHHIYDVDSVWSSHELAIAYLKDNDDDFVDEGLSAWVKEYEVITSLEVKL